MNARAYCSKRLYVDNLWLQTSLRHTWHGFLKTLTGCVSLPSDTHTTYANHTYHMQRHTHTHMHTYTQTDTHLRTKTHTHKRRDICTLTHKHTPSWLSGTAAMMRALRRGRTCTLSSAKQHHTGMTSSPGVEIIGWPPSTGSSVSPADT